MSAVMANHIWNTFQQTANKYSEKTAVVFLGSRYPYQKVKQLALNFATALVNLGVQPGQRVIIYIPNSIQWIIAWLGIQRIGGICVPITPIYTPYDIHYIATHCEAKIIICSDTNFGYVKKVLPDTEIQDVIVTNIADLLPSLKRYFGYLFDVIPKGKISLDANTFGFMDLVSTNIFSADSLPVCDLSGSTTAEILYTGGTTKFPKGVPISHDLFLASAKEQICISEPLIPADKNIIMGNAPLFHILGQTCGLATLLVGGTLILQPRINLDATFEAIRRFKARTMIGVPTLYRMILEHDRLDHYDLSSVQYWFCAGDVLPVEVNKRWHEKFGISILQGYGATETCGGVALCPVDQPNPPKSVGRVLASKKIKIIDPISMEPVKTGEAGELLVTSKHMVSSYLNKPDETTGSFIEIDGVTWYRTADVMSMDTDGNLYFVDRTVDTIKHKGYRVSASEIEAVLQEHFAVIGACVIGLPDAEVGERIKAYVVLKEDIKGITGYDLIKWCRNKLAAYKVPQYIEFRDMLPKSKVGKLLRREIRNEETRRADS